MAYGKIGIALGGGAARGWAHIGVLRALSQAGIVPANTVMDARTLGAVRMPNHDGFIADPRPEHFPPPQRAAGSTAR